MLEKIAPVGRKDEHSADGVEEEAYPETHSA